MCRVLGVSRSGFFAWCQRPPSAASQRRAELTEQVRQVHEANRKVYGSPRVHRALREAGVAVCVNTVAKLMRLAGIQGQKKHSFVPRTTDSSATTWPAPNTLSGNFAIGAINRR